MQVNRQRLDRSRDLLGVVRVTVFSPDDLTLGEGRPGGSAALPRRHARRAGREVRRAAAGARPDRAPAQRPVAPGRRPPRRVGGNDARRVGRQAGRRRGPVRPRPRHAGRADLDRSSARRTSSWRADRPAIGLEYDPPWRAGRTGVGAGPGPRHRPASRRLHGRTAPRRARADDRPGCRPAPTPRRASSAPWPWRCGSPPTDWWPTARGRRRCSCSTTCCPSSIPAAPRRCSAHLPPGQIVITTASAVPAAARPERVLRVQAGVVTADEVGAGRE